jgi:hypothetical protein
VATCCHDHDHDGHDHADEPGAPCHEAPSKSCDEAECSFDIGARTAAPQSTWIAPVALLPAAAPVTLPTSHLEVAGHSHAPFSALPLRAHLLLQVFLI